MVALGPDYGLSFGFPYQDWEVDLVLHRMGLPTF